MRFSHLRGVITRRLLINYRVDPRVAAAIIPPPFRPQLVDGHAIAGICLIRLERLRPAGLPPVVGLSSENAAHRFAVEWEDADGRTRAGVYIARRDTSSRLSTWVGGRLFPGVHHHARFRASESRDRRLRLDLRSHDGQADVALETFEADFLPKTSVFPSIEAASRFFEQGSCGYSPAAAHGGTFDGLELRTHAWSVRPAAVWSIRSAYFSDAHRFPPGSAELDCALIMRGVQHEWRELPPVCGGVRQGVATGAV